jgi:hypothetical protein
MSVTFFLNMLKHAHIFDYIIAYNRSSSNAKIKYVYIYFIPKTTGCSLYPNLAKYLEWTYLSNHSIFQGKFHKQIMIRRQGCSVCTAHIGRLTSAGLRLSINFNRNLRSQFPRTRL